MEVGDDRCRMSVNVDALEGKGREIWGANMGMSRTRRLDAADEDGNRGGARGVAKKGEGSIRGGGSTITYAYVLSADYTERGHGGSFSVLDLWGCTMRGRGRWGERTSESGVRWMCGRI
ncbi:hypothetical protein BC628DRAFT_311076 [Trametes gibbosa]|nr:hypothetical protein BC628DRAFT_311076 [Trametes gibbosa]